MGRKEQAVECRRCGKIRPYAGGLICWKCQVEISEGWPDA